MVRVREKVKIYVRVNFASGGQQGATPEPNPTPYHAESFIEVESRIQLQTSKFNITCHDDIYSKMLTSLIQETE